MDETGCECLNERRSIEEREDVAIYPEITDFSLC
jgi:hypothetical protein